MPRKTKKAKIKATTRRKELKSRPQQVKEKIFTAPTQVKKEKKVTTPTTPKKVSETPIPIVTTTGPGVIIPETTYYFKKDLSKSIFLSILLISSQIFIFLNQQYNWFQITIPVFK